jgi:hypothetical protein
MEHPEKALFDEIRSLRKELENSKDRIFKLEKEYEDKIQNLEIRNEISIRCEEKIEKWLSDSSRKLKLIRNEKEYTFFRSTFEINSYSCNSNLLPTDEDTCFLDISSKYFKALIEIIRKGHLVKNREIRYGRNLEKFLDAKLLEDQNFPLALMVYFDNENIMKIVNDFGLNFTYYGGSKGAEIFDSHSTKSAFSSNDLLNYITEDVKSLADINNQKAFFIDKNGNLNIQFTEILRVKSIYIKPFVENKLWNPSQGRNETKILGSIDGELFEEYSKIPENFGLNLKTPICEVTFDSPHSFKYLKFETNGSFGFSLSYLGFTKISKKL